MMQIVNVVNETRHITIVNW